MERLTKVGAALEEAVVECDRMRASGDVAAFDKLREIVCFALPIYNLVAPMFQLPAIPVPSFCNV